MWLDTQPYHWRIKRLQLLTYDDNSIDEIVLAANPFGISTIGNLQAPAKCGKLSEVPGY
jgi:hypothetical protein